MVRPLSRPLHVTLLTLATVLLFSAAFGGLAQSGEQVAPLFRDDRSQDVAIQIVNADGDVLKSYKPNDILGSLASPVWIQKENALGFSLRYDCIVGFNNNGIEQPDSDCELGDAGSGALDPRTILLYYNTSGEQPDRSTDASILLTKQVTVEVNANTGRFTGQLGTDELATIAEGQSLTFLTDIRLDGADSQCDGEGTPSGAIRCQDPLHTTGEETYEVRVDDSVPEIVLTDPPNAVARKLGATSWFLYSSQNMSNFLPTLTVTAVDQPTGAPLIADTLKLYRENQDNTSNFQRQKVSDTAYAHTYQYPSSGARSFQQNTATRIDVFAEDLAAHTLDTRTNSNPAVWVVIDNTPPTVNVDSNQQGDGGSHLERQSGADGLAALGEPMRIYVNATDVAGDKVDGSGILNTPKSHLTATVRFQGGPNNGTVSDPIEVPFNATACTPGCFHTADARIPDEWVNGATYANVTITDPVGQSVSAVIQGSVNVDVALPVVTPMLPLDGTDAELFTQEDTVTFRLRAHDPGDQDEWNGAQTQDTDDFGIAHDKVHVRYKIGADGVLRSGKMTPQSAEDHFQWINTFGDEDSVYYFFEVQDRAGNTATWPAAGDPNILLNTTANGGRFLHVQVDKRGPTIEPATELNYLGGGPHELAFTVTDGGIGVDDATVKLFWRTGSSGTFTELHLTPDAEDANVYKGNIPTQEDGARVHYYVAAADRLGNPATYGSLGNPRSATIDLTAPEVTVNAPATATTSTFNVTWSATDTGSGVKDYTLQFRIAPGGAWFTVPDRTNTTETYYNVCAATGKTYEFRVSARDRAGNERSFPETADASSFVDAATSCAQAPQVTISSPAGGATLSGSVDITWNAVSTTAPGDLSVSLQVGSGTTFETIARDLSDQGTYEWDSGSHDVTVACVPDGTHTLRVVAVDPNGLEGRATVDDLTLDNGITDCDDRDADGLPDAWETAHFGDLSKGPSDDDDNDGFSNADEFKAGSDPQDDSSRPDLGGTGGPAGVDLAGWSNLYILVILGFVGVLAVFVIGMTRRW